MGGGRWGVVRDRLASYKQRHDCDAVRHPSYQATNTNEAGTLETQKTGKKKKNISGSFVHLFTQGLKLPKENTGRLTRAYIAHMSSPTPEATPQYKNIRTTGSGSKLQNIPPLPSTTDSPHITKRQQAYDFSGLLRGSAFRSAPPPPLRQHADTPMKPQPTCKASAPLCNSMSV